MKRLTRQFMYGLGHKDCCDACSVCDVAGCCDSLEEMLEKLAHYEHLEEQLEKLYGGKMPLDEVVENLNRIVQNGEEKLDYARILTNAEAEKWDKYKDLEEHSRLIELPCAVGDAVWTIDPDITFIDDFKVTDIDIMKEGIAICNHYLGYSCDVNDFGKTVFLTKEEAEAKLKERGEQE